MRYEKKLQLILIEWLFTYRERLESEMATYTLTNEVAGITKTYQEIITADDVTEEILSDCEDIESGWYSEESRIDWEDFFDRRLDGYPLKNGNYICLGNEYDTPAMKKIKRHINKVRRES